MASRELESPPRKRRSSERGREKEHEPRKKKKESKSSTREKTKPSKKKSSKDTRSSGLRVRTVTELAALVASGAVRVPQSLQHYVADRTQLLDQVFTILSQEDVIGMLPDVLKGLRMKRIKQLCLNQLQSMREEEILSVIEADDSMLENSLNNTLLQLLGASGTSDAQSPKRDDEFVKHEGVKCDPGEEGSGCRKDEAIEITVSDVSDDEQREATTSENTHSQKDDPKTDSSVEKHDSLKVEEPGSETMEEGAREGSESSDSEPEDMTGVNQLLEMELRQRALESALKKASSSQHTESQVDDTSGSPSLVQTESESVTGGPPLAKPEDLSPDEVGQMLEQRLREKLLQSLAAKRK